MTDTVSTQQPVVRKGERLVQVALGATALFTATAFTAVLYDGARIVNTAVALVLFFAGIVAFLVAYLRAVVRSTSEVLGVGGIFFLSGCAPRRVRVRLLGALAAQVVVALVTASLRPYTSLAFGMLVPMFGVGMSGLWGAFHGAYPARPEPSASLPVDE